MTDRLEEIKRLIGNAELHRLPGTNICLPIHLYLWLVTEVERLQGAPLRQQADRLMQEVHNLTTELREVYTLQDQTYHLNVKLQDTITTLRGALRKHGIHSPKCQSLKDELQASELPSHMHLPPYKVPAGKIRCVCGLDEALAATEGK